MRSGNPFAPTFGTEPPLLAGRDGILGDISGAWEAGSTHPGYTTLLLGRRGTGKTVILEALRKLAHARGWLTVAEAAASPGLLNRLGHKALVLLNEQAPELSPDLTRTLWAAGIGLGSDYDPAADLSRRVGNVLKALTAHLQRAGAGLVITIDELHAGDTDELRMLGIVVQDITRIARLPMAYVGAGLPVLEDTLLADTHVTFLQRCTRHEVGFLDHAAAWSALSEPIRERGGRLAPNAAEHGVAVSQGYPFMIQLVGFHAWEAAPDPASLVDMNDMRAGAEEARRQVGQLVISPMWRDLSEGSQRFLAAMAVDEGPSHPTDLAARLGVTSGYVSVYKGRLRTAGMISPAGNRRLDFAIGAARQWIRNLDEYPLLCETLKLAERPPVGFTRPGAESQPDN